MSPVYDCDGVRVYHGDCLQLLPALRDQIQAIVSDPPYGMDWDTDSTRFSGGKGSHFAKSAKVYGDDEPFDPTHMLVFPRVTLWGANHYAAKLPVGTTLVWIKKNPEKFGQILSDAEIGWQRGGVGTYCFRCIWDGCARETENGEHYHPTQKPVALMEWCIKRLKLPPGSLVCDPYAGSGSTAIACRRLGLPCILIEKDDRYIPVIIQRLRECETPLFRSLDAS